MISRPGCPFCSKAKEMLEQNGMDFEEIVLGQDANLRSVRAMTGLEMVPQIFIDGNHIGGAEELEAFLSKQKVA